MLQRWVYAYRTVAAEISVLSRYCDRLVQVGVRTEDSGVLFDAIRCPSKVKVAQIKDLKPFSSYRDDRTAILMNGDFNYSLDIQSLLSELKGKLNRASRVVVVTYNPYLSFLYRLANRLGLRSGEQPITFLTKTDLHNLAVLSGYEVVRIRPTLFVPWRLLGLGSLINFIFPAIPVLRSLSLVNVLFLRPVIVETKKPSLSIVIPARNEKGNIENALKRMPDLGCDLEVIFVEGHSSDGTWEEIERVAAAYAGKFRIQAHRQTGKGKNDAVRLGFSRATGELVTILDADLTMPPEKIGRFYDAYCLGQADFVNGTRLVYPMEGDAMRFLNRLGNVFFAKALSTVLDTPLGDSLCGTKLLTRHDYQRIVRWRQDFGDFDPFGDFELLFPAALLSLGVIDIPIRYLARTYGSTNISRFRHGFMLLRMTLIGLFRIRMGRGSA
jgi:hypothetical protein